MYTDTGTLIMSLEELAALHPEDDIERAYVEELREMTDVRLIESRYAAHYAIKSLPKASNLHEDTLRAHEWTKRRAPFLAAEVRRRNLALPRWAVVE